jgi:hypothetical protein
MYKASEQQIILPFEFYLPFGGKLNPENKWCKLAAIIPWHEIEKKYAKSFPVRRGQQAYPARTALGALIIQNIKTLSDRDTLEEISENPYLQYFIGLSAFVEKAPFSHTLMTHFRKRLGKNAVNEINEMITLSVKHTENIENTENTETPAETENRDRRDDANEPRATAPTDIPAPDKQAPEPPTDGTMKTETTAAAEKKNAGKLILDATCTPADIHYPTDLWLLNQARQALEEIIDVLHAPHQGKVTKPRTYRRLARKSYVNIDKKKKVTAQLIRKGIGQQLRYIRRNQRIIEKLIERSPLTLLSKRQYRNLLVSREIYRQQLEMYQKKTHTVEERIVSLCMPFIRPIVRGKTHANVEFGAKLALSIINGYSFMEKLSFNAFNESKTLIQSLENYYQKYGVYPETVYADKIYRNRENLSYCKERRIRLNGPPLGRPAKDPEVLRAQRKQERIDAGIRNAVEGKIGEGKRAYGLGRIMARLQETSETVVALQLLAMNLERRLRILLRHFIRRYFALMRLAY